jgi:hypothetical protein
VSQFKTSLSDLTFTGNCEPRLPAAHFLVKKEGPNKGKWFYTCQESKEEGCGFFLWDDSAVGREMRAVINNTNSEMDQPRTTAEASRDKRTVEGHNAASNKWIQDLGKANKDEFGEWPLSGEEEKEIVHAASHSIPGAYPETPRKAIKTPQFLTPGSKRKVGDGYLPTPSTISHGDDVFGSPSTSRRKGGMFNGTEPLGLRSPSITPTPNRFRDASATSESSQQNYDITDEVIDLLKDQHIAEETAASLRTLLNRHALKISGIAKGRDITRVALKSKDGKIAELQQKVTALEAAREMDRAVIRQLRGETTGRGRGIQ